MYRNINGLFFLGIIVSVLALATSCKKEKSVFAVADFTYSGRTDTVPTTIQFINKSYGLTYSWDFGDGNSSTDKNPNHTFNQAGTYNVKLIAKGTNNSDTMEIVIGIGDIIPRDGLVGWWPFNGNANDESGNGNHGTINGPTLTTDRYGNQNEAYDFDGINDNISLSNVPFINQITLSFWINIPFDGGGITIVQNCPFFPYNTSFATSSLPTNYHQYILYSNNCPLTAQNYYLNHSGSIVNSWHNLVYTIDKNSDCRLYFDGIFQGLYNGSNFENCSNKNTNLRFGGNWVSNDPQWFKGKLDDIGIWNRALTQEEITSLYNRGT